MKLIMLSKCTVVWLAVSKSLETEQHFSVTSYTAEVSLLCVFIFIGLGNPALDPPPKYQLNSKSGKQELVNPSVPGNIVPQV